MIIAYNKAMFKGIFKSNWFLLPIFTLSGILFSEALGYPFFQDDFFVLQTSRIDSLTDIFRLIGIQDLTVYWRPIGIQLYFALLQALKFDSPLVFHLIGFFFHLTNIYLVYILSKLVIRNIHSARLTAFFYGVSPLHYFALGWAVNFSYLIVVTLVLLVLIFALSHRFILSLICMILALASNELAISTPFLLVIVLMRLHEENHSAKKRSLQFIVAIFSITVGYLIWRFLQGIRVENDYVLSLFAPLYSLRWYGLWMIGLSDIVRDQMENMITFQTLFTMNFPWVVFAYIFQIGMVSLIFGGMVVESIRSKRWMIERLFQVGWIIIGLAPVLFFPAHLYSHYAALASVGFYWMISQFLVELNTPYNLVIRQGAIGIWVLIAIVTLRLNYLASWMSDHARESESLKRRIMSFQSEISPSTLIYVTSLSRKAEIVLGGEYGISYLTELKPQNVRFAKSLEEAYYLETGIEGVEISADQKRQLLKDRGTIVINL
jgi:hypothetical protein